MLLVDKWKCGVDSWEIRTNNWPRRDSWIDSNMGSGGVWHLIPSIQERLGFRCLLTYSSGRIVPLKLSYSMDLE